MEQTYQYIQEDKKEHYLIEMMLLPLARTAMSDEGGRAMQNYGKSVEKALEGLTPWMKQTRTSDLRRKVKSGTVVVIPDSSESPNDPLFKDATILNQKRLHG